MRKSNAQSKKRRLRVRKAATRELFLRELSEGVKTVEQLEEATKDLDPKPSRRTIDNALTHLQKEKIVKRVERGRYALSTFIPLKEMFGRVEDVGRFYSAHGNFYASLDEFSRDTGIPKEYEVKVGEGGVTFADVVFMVGRKFGIKIGTIPSTTGLISEYTSPEMEEARRTQEKERPKDYRRKTF